MFLHTIGDNFAIRPFLSVISPLRGENNSACALRQSAQKATMLISRMWQPCKGCSFKGSLLHLSPVADSASSFYGKIKFSMFRVTWLLLCYPQLSQKQNRTIKDLHYIETLVAASILSATFLSISSLRKWYVGDVEGDFFNILIALDTICMDNQIEEWRFSLLSPLKKTELCCNIKEG